MIKRKPPTLLTADTGTGGRSAMSHGEGEVVAGSEAGDALAPAARKSSKRSIIGSCGPRRIAIACDASQSTMEAVQWTLSELATTKDTLILVHVMKMEPTNKGFSESRCQDAFHLK